MRSLKLTLVILVGFVLGVGLLSMVGASLALAEDVTYTVNVKYPFYMLIYVPCAAGGTGEDVELSGELHYLYHFTIDDSGGYHGKWHFNSQSVTGTGWTTGDKYQATEVTQDQFNGKVGVEDTFVNNFRVIGQGPNNNLLVHGNFHITVNPDGTVTSYHHNYKYECK